MAEPQSVTVAAPAGPAAGRPRLVICAKSRWDPPIRREHGVAVTAAAQGYDVDFIEQARDVRALRPQQLAQLVGPWRRQPFASAPEGVRPVARFTPVPGHRHPWAHRVDAAGLRVMLTRLLRSGPLPEAVIVNAPWNWAATDVLPAGVRRVLDLGDDWATLLPQRRDAVLADYARISAEADAIVVVAPGLAERFGREVAVVPNAVAPELLSTAPIHAPGQHRMTYVGTLSERFDSTLIAEVLRLLPEWSLDLYGPSHYAGMGGEAGPPLQALLDEFPGRAAWHGMVLRRDLSTVLDRGDVLVLPNDPSISKGQDSMKLYDYAARARPIVATPIRVPDDGPAVLALAADPRTFADAVQHLDGADATANRSWAEANGWSARLPRWLEAVTGRPS